VCAGLCCHSSADVLCWRVPACAGVLCADMSFPGVCWTAVCWHVVSWRVGLLRFAGKQGLLGQQFLVTSTCAGSHAGYPQKQQAAPIALIFFQMPTNMITAQLLLWA
jgi:hypothetical protein